MSITLKCAFSANDNELPFTAGKTYQIEDVRGFNHLRGIIKADNGVTVRVETVAQIVMGMQTWVVKDFRHYSKYMSYAAFHQVSS